MIKLIKGGLVHTLVISGRSMQIEHWNIQLVDSAAISAARDA